MWTKLKYVHIKNIRKARAWTNRKELIWEEL